MVLLHVRLVGLLFVALAYKCPSLSLLWNVLGYVRRTRSLEILLVIVRRVYFLNKEENQ